MKTKTGLVGLLAVLCIAAFAASVVVAANAPRHSQPAAATKFAPSDDAASSCAANHASAIEQGICTDPALATGYAIEAMSNRKCGHGIQACSASQVGQPCNPNDLNVICSAQSNGSYCCLAYAP